VNKPKIYIWDLEFFASQNARHHLKIDPGYIIAFCCKELDKPKMTCFSMLSHPGKHPTDDSVLVKKIGEHLKEADIHVFHYGTNVDYPFINTKLLKYGLPLVPSNNMVDTCKVAQRKLGLKSNSLASVARFFNLKEEKMPVTEDEWHLAFAGHKPTLKKVEQRCASDVRLTEEIYKRLRPVMDKHPHVGLWGGYQNSCPVCGSFKLVKNGTRMTVAKLTQRLMCSNCGANQHVKIEKK